MDCSCAQRQIHAYLDGALPACERRALEAHIRACPRCKEELNFKAWMTNTMLSHFKAPVEERYNLTAATLAQLDAQPIGVCTEARGKPRAQSLTTPKPLTLKRGTPLHLHDRITTGEVDALTVRFNDGSEVRVGFNTTVELRDESGRRGKEGEGRGDTSSPLQRPSLLRLWCGALWSKVEKGLGAFTIQTPMASATALGTEFEVFVPPAATMLRRAAQVMTILRVMEGAVQLRNAHGSVVAEKGTESRAQAHRPPTKPRLIGYTHVASVGGHLFFTGYYPLCLSEAFERGMFLLREGDAPAEPTREGDAPAEPTGSAGASPSHCKVVDDLRQALEAQRAQFDADGLRLSVRLARMAFQEAVHQRPQDAAAWNNLGVTWQLEDDMEQAITAFRRAYALHRGQGQMVDGQWSMVNEATNHQPLTIDHAVPPSTLFSEEAVCGCNLGYALAAIGNFPEAEEVLRGVVRRHPNYDLGHYELGYLFLSRGQGRRALLCASKISPSNPLRENLKAFVALMLRQQPRRAERHLQAALAFDPNFVRGLTSLAWLLCARGRSDLAEPLARRAVQLAPDNHRSHNQLAICIRHTNTQQAVAHWLKALELQPEVGLPLSNLVGIYWQMGKLDEAIPLAEWRVRLDVKWSPLPNLFIASWLLYLLEETERYEDALRWARWLVRRGAPADVTTLCRIRCLVRRERKEQARQLWAMVTVIPNTDVRYGLSVPCLWTARLYLQRGDAEVGLHWLGRVQEAYPEASRWTAFLADKAWALRRAGDFEAAIAVAQEATRLDPLYVGGWFELAAACEAQGDHARALRAYRRILRLAPHESLIQQAIEGCTSPHPQGQPLPQRERPMWWTV